MICDFFLITIFSFIRNEIEIKTSDFFLFYLNKTMMSLILIILQEKLEVDVTVFGSKAPSLPNKPPFHIGMNNQRVFY